MLANSKRPYCRVCQRPMQTCLCHWVTHIPNQVELVILQHPLEVKNAKNTARLLHLCLRHSELIEGEKFPDDFLSGLLERDNKSNLLLYPSTPEEGTLGLAVPEPMLDRCSAVELRLIVIDGTWRKSRKMLYLNPMLQSLPRLSLSSCPPSMYAIRKAQKDNQLSTLEASCYALQQLENNRVDFAPLLNAFEGFVRQQLALLPSRN